MPAFRPSSHRPLGIHKVDMGEYKRGKSTRRKINEQKKETTRGGWQNVFVQRRRKRIASKRTSLSRTKSRLRRLDFSVAGSNSIGGIATNNCLRKSISSSKILLLPTPSKSDAIWYDNMTLIPPSLICFVISTKSFISRDIPQALSDVVENF